MTALPEMPTCGVHGKSYFNGMFKNHDGCGESLHKVFQGGFPSENAVKTEKEVESVGEDVPQSQSPDAVEKTPVN